MPTRSRMGRRSYLTRLTLGSLCEWSSAECCMCSELMLTPVRPPAGASSDDGPPRFSRFGLQGLTLTPSHSFNTRTYPNFLAFLIEENIPYLSSDMSFAVSRDRGLYEWAGASPAAVFAQRINLLNPAQWRMVWDILRFNTGALEVLREGKKESIGSYLARRGYSNSFVDNYLLVSATQTRLE